jgi:hypothetical protein
VPQVTARSCPARLPPPGALRCGPACPTSPLSVCDGRWPGSVGKVPVHHAKPLPFGSLAHRAGGRSGASVALVRYGHPLRFYITPHCPQCPAVAALKLRFVPFTASRPSGEGNGTLCKVAYAIRRWSCAVAYVSCFASVPVGGPCAGHHGTKDCGISRFAGDGYTVQRSGTGGYIVATWGKSNTEKESACYVLCSTLSLSGAVFGW